MPSDAPIPVTGSLRVFGHEDSAVALELIPRSTGWRGVRAGALTLGGLVLAPVVALLPPHAAWALGSAVAGLVLGIRKWNERFTLMRLEGPCPRCGATVRVQGPTRFRNGSTLGCDNCHHASTLTVPPDALPDG